MGKSQIHLFIVAGTCLLFAGCISLPKRDIRREHTEFERPSRVDPAGKEFGNNLPELGENSTLPNYLAYAALNNPGLEAAFNRWQAALEKVLQVMSLPDPRFTYAHFIEEVETRVGPQEYKLSLSQMFPWFGKLRLRGDVASQNANAAGQRYEAVKLKLFYRVKHAYYEYYWLGRAIAITKENIELLGYLEKVARTKYQAGIAPYSAIIKMQVELGKLEDRIRTLKDLREPIVARFNAALNRSTDAELPLPKELREEKVGLSTEDLLEWLRENNPELKAIDFKAAKEKAAVDLARKNRYPDFMLGVTYVDTDDALMAGAKDSGKDPVIAMLSINLPIWQGKYAAEEREAKARYVAAVEERTDRENEMIAGLKMTLYGFRDAGRKINLYRDTLIPKAEQALKVTQQAFEAGKADVLDLIDAERTLLEFGLSFERALANRAQKLAEIEMLVGKEVPRSGSDAEGK